MMEGTHYLYGMRLRGFSPMCQPTDGLIQRKDDWCRGRYHDILVYDRKLTDKELEDYELDFIDESHPAVLD